MPDGILRGDWAIRPGFHECAIVRIWFIPSDYLKFDCHRDGTEKWHHLMATFQWVAARIHLCICQALAEPLRRQLYQAPVSMHFLASTIVSGFGDCIWAGSPGGAVSEWPFLQSLLHTLSPYFFIGRHSLLAPKFHDLTYSVYLKRKLSRNIINDFIHDYSLHITRL